MWVMVVPLTLSPVSLLRAQSFRRHGRLLTMVSDLPSELHHVGHAVITE